MQENEDEIKLNQSKLSNIEYWNDFYKRERKEFSDDSDFTGEIWFDENGAEQKMIDFLIQQLDEEQLFSNKDVIEVLDVGTGNAHFMVEFAEQVVEECDLASSFAHTGIDYSPDSVEFAQQVIDKKLEENEAIGEKHKFTVEQVDVLQKNCEFLAKNKERFDILVDKGTLDAIALSQVPLEEFDGKKPFNVYASQVSQVMKKGSILLITSCNFTEDELVKIITSDKNTGLSVMKKLKYPSFKFGGTEGSTICTIAFVKN
ncbi:methyltransferase domain-containing protein [Scheffersomyces xylosifermentans]|uniref:methyltransferase domain-containing protein n=1 Tax=Scheffersomyces xylosifermentans TaxID=1304137 RepID=UPI00315D0A8D